MRNHHSRPNARGQRWQASLWPWGLALGLALALSVWWTWDLFKPPSENSAHPRLPFATGKPPAADKAQALKLEGTQGPITVPPTGAGGNNATEAAPPSSAY
jgi:hypothetical protein